MLKDSLQKIKTLKRKTKIILGIVLIVIVLILIPVLKSEKPTYETGFVARGDVIQEVSANGMVQSIDEIDLRFKTNGTVERILVKVGDKVKKGVYLVSLDSGTVYSQYLQAQASYSQVKAKLDQLLAGASSEEIKVSEQVLENARIALEDARDKAENDLNQDYGSALVYLIDSSSKYNKALADLKDIERLYFYYSDSLSVIFRDKNDKAEEAYLGTSKIKGAKDYVDDSEINPTYSNIDAALDNMWLALQKITDALDYTKTAMSDPSTREKVSTTDRTTIDTNIVNLNAAVSNINTAKADIANQKVTNQININTVESAYNKAKVDLEKLQASPRVVDIAVYQADVDKYKANLAEYSKKLSDASIIAPFDGIIAKIDVRIGEVITVGEKVIVSLTNPEGLQIEIDIPETDISKVSMDDPVLIILDALPEESFLGQIIEIDSSKTIIDSVVYYKVKILFEGDEQKIKSGMSGEATIQAEKRDNVLNVPQRAVVSKNSKKFVRVLDGEEIVETEVTTGLRGNKGEIEILSGLSEGEKIITFMKN
ncbi:efflux RND transporter periplasmic adaptor subunit [Patescibacteria group bacterium]|nr:efflux RND transporter periplasmic adaptor subunit [Patescibacteria group bacterium]MCG2696128.1 efflux RND transporter periplasmic adaptor subunit [Candidatus Portnoybacteria bacterium]